MKTKLFPLKDLRRAYDGDDENGIEAQSRRILSTPRNVIYAIADYRPSTTAWQPKIAAYARNESEHIDATAMRIANGNSIAKSPY